ncbi:hypothetical protein HRG_012039 [Hirsutella rhossiliensis]
MEICEKGEIFIEKDDDMVFDHAKIILRGANGEYLYAKTHQRIFQGEDYARRENDLYSLLKIRAALEKVDN